jgi:hypothetical protein
MPARAYFIVQPTTASLSALSTTALVVPSCPHSHSHSFSHPHSHSHTPNNALKLKLALNRSRACTRVRAGVRSRASSLCRLSNAPQPLPPTRQPVARGSTSTLVLVYHLAADSRVSRAPAAGRAPRPLPTALRSPLSALRSRSSSASRPPLASSNRRPPRLRVWRTSSIAPARFPTRPNWPPGPTPHRPCASPRPTSRHLAPSPPLSTVGHSYSPSSFSMCDVHPRAAVGRSGTNALHATPSSRVVPDSIRPPQPLVLRDRQPPFVVIVVSDRPSTPLAVATRSILGSHHLIFQHVLADVVSTAPSSDLVHPAAPLSQH